MKKLILCLILALTLCFGVGVMSAQASEPVAETEKVYTVDEVKQIVLDYANENIKNEQLKQIITWAIDGGLGIALITIYLKYRKYKHNTLEDMVNSVKKVGADFLTTNFDKLSDETLKPIYDAISEVKGGLETVMKVLVLMQDNTAQGKIALINFLGVSTGSEEVKESVSAVENSIQAEEQKKAEINSEVAGDYKEIF